MYIFKWLSGTRNFCPGRFLYFSCPQPPPSPPEAHIFCTIHTSDLLSYYINVKYIRVCPGLWEQSTLRPRPPSSNTSSPRRRKSQSSSSGGTAETTFKSFRPGLKRKLLCYNRRSLSTINNIEASLAENVESPVRCCVRDSKDFYWP